MNKETLRNIHLNLRKQNKKENNIFERVISLPIYKQSKKIAIYYSTKDEVDTINLIKYSLKENKEVYLPKVTGKKEMSFYRITSLDKKNFTKSKFGILEPIEENKTDSIELTIVPGICFDKEKNRLGYGGGFYDTYLQKNKTYKIGLCYHNNLIDKLPKEEHDIPMDMIITEKEVIK